MNKIKPEVQQILLQSIATNSLYISDISLWELAMLINKKRLIVTKTIHHWIQDCLSNLNLRTIAFNPEIVSDSVQLPDNFHGDPADQLIVATARYMDAVLITKDQKTLTWSQQAHAHTLEA